MRPRQLHNQIYNQSVNHGRHECVAQIPIWIHHAIPEYLNDVLARCDWTSTVDELLRGEAGEGLGAEGEDDEVGGGVFEEGEVVEGEGRGHVDALPFEKE